MDHHLILHTYQCAAPLLFLSNSFVLLTEIAIVKKIRREIVKSFRSLSVLLLMLTLCGVARLQDTSITYFVSVTGSDDNDGLTEATAFRTVTQAWNMIPMGQELTQGVIIDVMPGTYGVEDLPNYWESRYGTEYARISIVGKEDGPVIFPSINMYDTRYVTFSFLEIVSVNGMPFHCEKCDHVSLLGNVIRGDEPGGGVRETVKFNQSQYIVLAGNDISGADDNAIDFVAVQYAAVVKNIIHDAGDWCMYAKGGSAYIAVAENEIYDCGTGGFTAGQGTGFQFMTPPWLQYEAYAVIFNNNIVHDTFGAGVGINGGYDIIVQNNTFYKVGERSHVIEVVYGLRSCDGQIGDEGRERCVEYRDMGGWGNDLPEDGIQAVQIPNKNVYILNNIVYNPSPFQSADQHFTIAPPYDGLLQADSNLGRVVADENLRIQGNVIWNGDSTMFLGVEPNPDYPAGCQDDNPTCNATQLLADNAINTVEPQFKDADKGDFTLLNREALSTLFSDFKAPNLPAWDVPVPAPDPQWFAYPIGQ